MLADLLSAIFICFQASTDRIEHIAAVGSEHLDSASGVGELGQNGGPVAGCHRQNHVGLADELLGQRLAFMAA